MTLLKEIMPVDTFFFRSMPTTIWGTVNLQNVDIDMQLQLQNLVASPLTEYYKTQIPILATNIFNKYETNWQKIWDTVRVDYDTFITSTSTETFTSETIESKDIDRNVTREATENSTVNVDDTTITDGTIGTIGSSSNDSTNQVNRFGMGSGGSGSPESNTTDESIGSSNTTENNDTTVTSDTDTVGLNEVNSSEIDNTDIAGNVTVTETRNIEGSSPLRTFQALINEEIDGRSGLAWNAYQLFVDDVRRELTLKIYP